jgi:hypothetical protein
MGVKFNRHAVKAGANPALGDCSDGSSHGSGREPASPIGQAGLIHLTEVDRKQFNCRGYAFAAWLVRKTSERPLSPITSNDAPDTKVREGLDAVI